jgi:hypothetical protein
MVTARKSGNTACMVGLWIVLVISALMTVSIVLYTAGFFHRR